MLGFTPLSGRPISGSPLTVSYVGWLPTARDATTYSARTNIPSLGVYSYDAGGVVGEVIFPDKWHATYPDTIPRASRGVAPGGYYTYDFGIATKELNLFEWQPRFVDQAPRRRLGIIPSIGWVGYAPGSFVVEIITLDKWEPHFPSASPKRAKGAFYAGQQVYPFNISTAPTLLVDKWDPDFPDRVRSLPDGAIQLLGEFSYDSQIFVIQVLDKTCNPIEALGVNSSPLEYVVTVLQPSEAPVASGEPSENLHDCGTITVVVQ